ncbi:MAG: nuclear transport factor 2 family protein [Actinobacteria bacterium]|nr:nuclear transport factor 2 family protein [Actinomycetota bacterium]
MTSEGLDVIRRLHRAYQQGDLEAVASQLHPDVEWRAPGPDRDWDCRGRERVLHVLRDRAERVPPLERLELVDLGEDVLVGLPTEEPWGEPTWYQRVRVEDGLIVAIRDYGSREAALAGAGPAGLRGDRSSAPPP